MPAVTIELPPAIEQNLGAGGRDISRRALELLAVDGYRETRLSQRQVGEMLGMNFWETEAFLKKHEAYLQYDISDFNRDREALQRLEQQGNPVL